MIALTKKAKEVRNKNVLTNAIMMGEWNCKRLNFQRKVLLYVYHEMLGSG